MSALNQLHKTQTKLLSHQGLDQNISSTHWLYTLAQERSFLWFSLLWSKIIHFKAKVESFYTLVLINFFTDTAETLILYLFCQWKYKLISLKCWKLFQNCRNFQFALPWWPNLPKIYKCKIHFSFLYHYVSISLVLILLHQQLWEKSWYRQMEINV